METHLIYGCPVCGEKVTEPRQRPDDEPVFPQKLAVCNIATLENSTHAKVIANFALNLLGNEAT